MYGKRDRDSTLFHLFFSPVMTSKSKRLIKFLKLKPKTLYGFEREDVYEVILYCCERLHKFVIFD